MEFKKVFLYIFLLVVVFGVFGCQVSNNRSVYADSEYAEEIEQARGIMSIFLDQERAPGVAISVIKDGKLIYSEGFGLASTDLDVPVTRDTKFRIANVSELFTSMIYQLMVQDGTISPDSTIQKYIPDFPEKETEITLENLAFNSSGIREATGEEQIGFFPYMSLSQGLNLFKDDPQTFNAGSHQVYSQFNFNLLGAVMEQATGKTFDNILKDYITGPLQLDNVVIDNIYSTIPNRTDFYDSNVFAQIVNALSLNLVFQMPSVGILSNADDLAKFGNNVLHSDYINDEIRENIFVPPQPETGLSRVFSCGWMISDDSKGRRWYARGGNVTGGSANLLIYPDEDFVIAAATNLSLGTDQIPTFEIADIFLSKED